MLPIFSYKFDQKRNVQKGEKEYAEGEKSLLRGVYPFFIDIFHFDARRLHPSIDMATLV
jgi:hypothetical protein